ncbi:thioredoxin family protein [Mycoplasma hafezii]|uniref:thioredoxin family protein n=1 Tax=Mycoplasma hafezii TaxID=525886 RepID=UPI003CF76E98
MLKEVNKQEFLEAKKEGLQLLVFYADWCGPCKMFKSSLEELSEKDNITVFRVNIDRDKEFTRENNVLSIPYTNVLVDGEVVEIMQGYKPYDVLKHDLQKFMK